MNNISPFMLNSINAITKPHNGALQWIKK
ncbi:unnamed protein product [Spirodela intermedia]|uniref:Uncharacterized protein n=2 Tax=Spirodela intermedia TaxID=51605 RepID=A0A7I8K1Z9_SPIIN|nr:unnamed protein product [Spirodela intermedia]CAA6655659.1 unnamed protein product [Spirodela intermedia]CAA7390991.1 unnamed protein product [Spirodela intermedia]